VEDVPMILGTTKPYLFSLAWRTVVLVLFTSVPAHAYVDPGSGTMLWQLLLAAGAGVLLFGRRALARVVSLLRVGLRRGR
jgi:hypothetical protein